VITLLSLYYWSIYTKTKIMTSITFTHQMYKAFTTKGKSIENTRIGQLLLYQCIAEHKKYPKKLGDKMSILAI